MTGFEHGTLEWWRQQAVIDADRARRAEQETSRANQHAWWAREAIVVALRLLVRAGKLKASTDDERALLAWVEQQPGFHQPAANRCLAHPMRDDYEEVVVSYGQQVIAGFPPSPSEDEG